MRLALPTTLSLDPEREVEKNCQGNMPPMTSRAYGAEPVELNLSTRLNKTVRMTIVRKGRTTAQQITWSERGNLQGAQFYAVAGKVYELARAAKLGYELPTEMLLQDIRD